jgi:thiamine biosynthesis protein ThiS
MFCCLAGRAGRADNKDMEVLTKSLSLTVNGEAREFNAPLSVAGLVAVLGLDMRKVAVELNREIVPRSTYAVAGLRDGDMLEIVHFIGGG